MLIQAIPFMLRQAISKEMYRYVQKAGQMNFSEELTPNASFVTKVVHKTNHCQIRIHTQDMSILQWITFSCGLYKHSGPGEKTVNCQEETSLF